MNGAERIAAERRRQVEQEGWTPEHDDQWRCGELAQAAACYALVGPVCHDTVRWPWSPAWDKRPLVWPRCATRAQRVRALEKAGALIAAEIDRLLRVATTEGQS